MEEALFFGGAFNPVTVAHIHNAKYAMEKLSLSKVIFMPSKSSYILGEESKDFSFTEEERYQMLSIVAEKRPWMEVSDYEIRLDSQPRTYFTLKHLKEEGIQAKLLFGSDWLTNLKTKWRYVEEIGKEFSFVVMQRGNDDLKKKFDEDSYLKSLRPYFTFIDCPDEYQDVSSTKVRKALKERKYPEIKAMVPQEIQSYLERRFR